MKQSFSHVYTAQHMFCDVCIYIYIYIYMNEFMYICMHVFIYVCIQHLFCFVYHKSRCLYSKILFKLIVWRQQGMEQSFHTCTQRVFCSVYHKPRCLFSKMYIHARTQTHTFTQCGHLHIRKPQHKHRHTPTIHTSNTQITRTSTQCGHLHIHTNIVTLQPCTQVTHK
jgi:hypothetical protein